MQIDCKSIVLTQHANPAEEICHAVELYSVDFLIVGSHGLGTLQRYLPHSSADDRKTWGERSGGGDRDEREEKEGFGSGMWLIIFPVVCLWDLSLTTVSKTHTVLSLSCETPCVPLTLTKTTTLKRQAKAGLTTTSIPQQARLQKTMYTVRRCWHMTTVKQTSCRRR